MKRLLRISFNLAFFSFIPILSWFVLGLIVDKNLANVFSLTYPIQFIWLMLKSIFATGANITKEKDKNNNSVLSGMTLGIIISGIIFGIFAINIEKYIKFMNMDVSIYKEFGTYSVIQLYIHLVFSFVLEKLYYEGREKLANRYCVEMNMINFFVLISSALVLRNKIGIIVITLLSIFVYVLLITIKEYKKFKLEFNIIKYIKYDSANIFSNLVFFLIFLFGLSNAFEFGVEYIVALNFITLITDTQWDAFGAIETVAKIDISKGEFNYVEHRKNANKLLMILLTTIFIMFFIGFNFYNVDVSIAIIYLAVEVIHFIIFPTYGIKSCYLQLEYSPVVVTTNKVVSDILRMLISFFKTPFCTVIGQSMSAIYQMISVNVIFNKKYKINKNGLIEKIA